MMCIYYLNSDLRTENEKFVLWGVTSYWVTEFESLLGDRQFIVTEIMYMEILESQACILCLNWNIISSEFLRLELNELIIITEQRDCVNILFGLHFSFFVSYYNLIFCITVTITLYILSVQAYSIQKSSNNTKMFLYFYYIPI